MGHNTQADWHAHYAAGKGYRQLTDAERALLAQHAPAPEAGGRALDVGCGTGELAVHLAETGYSVDALDWADSALARAAGTAGVNWLRLDVERDDLTPLAVDGYDLITLRLVYAFFHDRTRILHDLADRLREDGALVVITPVAANTPPSRRDISLDDDEITLLSAGWEQAERFDADGLAVVILRGPGHTTTAVVDKPRPSGHAVTGACAVVTDADGRVLLARSTSGMWELPGGRAEPSEPFEKTAVRELAEETGLIADPDDVRVLSLLWDDNAGVARLNAVARVAAWSGTLQCREEGFVRWEWLDLHTVARLDRLFTPSAHALNAVWPGIIPGLPPARAYPHAIVHPRVDGEPAAAVRLRQQMAEAVIAGGWAPSPAVQQALREVPRHRYTPESPLRIAYDDDRSPVTRRDDAGRATSSVSAPWLQADMLESLRLQPGMTVLEVGSGGYNAELIAHGVAPDGRVVSVDIDDWVVERTRRFTAEAGSGRVTALQGDGRLGAPAHAPARGFDAIVSSHNCWDIAPAWREQLAEAGRLVLPLSIHGYTRAIAFEKTGDVLHARGFTFCGFVRDLGAAARPTPTVDLADGQLQLRCEDGPVPTSDGVDDALRAPRCEVPTGVTVAGQESFETLQLYLATTLPGFCRLAGTKGSRIAELPRGSNAAALVRDGSLAYLTHVRVHTGATPDRCRDEFVAHAFGPAGPVLADELADAVRAWDQRVRGRGYPRLAAYPAGTRVAEGPDLHVVDKTASRLVFDWDSLLKDAAEADEALAASVSAGREARG